MPFRIVIKPYGGLANRMRSMDSALILAGILHIRPKVIWEMSFELNCSFRHLFKLPDTFDLHEYYVNGFIKRSNDILVRNLAKIGIYLPSGFDKYLFDKEIQDLIALNYDFKNLLTSDQSVFIRTVHQFYTNSDSFKIFRPVDELMDVINQYSKSFTPNTIGIHIRRTDNNLSIKYSPLEGFIDLMNMEISRYRDTLFYLATDSSDDETRLKNIFGDRIITHTKILERNTEKGIQDALIDLYCLSKTSKILGSYYSSFSEVAAQINKIQLIQVYKS
jgi:hypothetical protein